MTRAKKTPKGDSGAVDAVGGVDTKVPVDVVDAIQALAPVELVDDATFASLGLAAPVLQAAHEAGYVRPTPIQREAIPLALSGRDIMGLAQTGTGKTAAFTLPIVDRLHDGPRRTRALILTPTRELCQQVEASVRKYATHAELDVASIYGGMPMEPQERALRAGVDIVVATPG
ncbi:MAG: DEAD/DEAH box helicase, partial [Gemmatimonadaceae bacterium]|nr:DEAD/DEAH box helicase [Gemmatimonadaceae bacterium]